MFLKNNKYAVLFIVLILLLIATIVCYYTFKVQKKPLDNNETEVLPSVTETTTNPIVLSTQGNDMIVETHTNSTIRVINEFDKAMFKGKKSILFMWGSWCSNCFVEMKDIKKILNYYKDSNINIVLISHDFEIESLISYLNQDGVDIDAEVLLDLGRVIRATLDPEASTIPITYFINENVEVQYKYDTAITFDKVQQILQDLKWI